MIDDPWLGDGHSRATVADIRRALLLYVVACLVNALAVAVVLYVRA
jgi:adenosylcobinamide-phosphate synthase